jgi:hypothetical protein
MAQIGSLTVDLSLQTAAFIRDLGKSSQAVATNTTKMVKSLAGLRASFLTVSKLGAGLLAGDFGLRGLRRLEQLVSESLKLAETLGGPIGDAAKKTEGNLQDLGDAFKFGVAQGFLKELDKNFEATQADLNTLTRLGERLGKVLGDAFTGAAALAERMEERATRLGDALDRFARLGLPQFGASASPLVSGENDTIGGVSTFAKGIQGATSDIEEFSKAHAELLREMADDPAFWQAITDSVEENRLATLKLAAGWLGVADTVGQALGTLFKDNKAVAIAQAVINTAQAITEALKLPFPLNWAQVAAVTALGAAQIATIVSTEPGTGSKAMKSSGGKGATAAAGAASRSGGNQGGGLQQSVNITIEGESFGPEHFKRLITGLNGVIADGAVLRVT